MPIFNKEHKILDFVRPILLKGKRVSIKEHREIRTLSQNRLYFLYLKCIEDETGQDKDDLHFIFKSKYLQAKNIEFGGEYHNIIKSTTELDTKQFTDYIEKIIVFASSELGIKLPDPKDLEFEAFKEFYSDRI